MMAQYLLGVLRQIIEEMDNKVSWIFQLKIRLAVINTSENAANNQLFGVSFVQVGCTIR
jgi:hypothetical protein